MHETVWSILMDPNHLGAEIIVDLALDAAAFPFVWMWRRRHDRIAHPNCTVQSLNKEVTSVRVDA